MSSYEMSKAKLVKEKKTNDDLVEECRTHDYYLKFKSPRDERVLDAMSKVDRADFVQEGIFTYNDCPVRIEHGQSCSQPSLVAFMDDILELEVGMKVLEIGAGCGYHAAVTSHLIGRQGLLIAIEYIDQLAQIAQRNLDKHFNRCLDGRLSVISGDGSVGYRQNAPYDRIYFTCGVDVNSFKPEVLARQLNPEGGILLFPEERGALFKQTYQDEIKVDEQLFKGISFVPLKGKNS